MKHEINTVIPKVQEAGQPRISTIPPIQTRNVSFPEQIWSPSSSSSISYQSARPGPANLLETQNRMEWFNFLQNVS